MERNSDIEVEPYEEIIGNLDCRTLLNSRSSSPAVAATDPTDQSAFYGPIRIDGRVGNVDFLSTELSTPAPRSDPRQELAVGRDERTAVVADQDGWCATLLMSSIHS